MTHTWLYDPNYTFETKMKMCIQKCIGYLDHEAKVIVLGNYFHHRLERFMEYQRIEELYNVGDPCELISQNPHSHCKMLEVETRTVNRRFLFGLMVKYSEDEFCLDIY